MKSACLSFNTTIRAVALLLVLFMLATVAACDREAENPDTSSTDSTGGTDAAACDYDLTTMNSNMVYAVVYDMLYTNRDNYIGKTIRMSGIYRSIYYEPTNGYYHYVVIADALACCEQGVEFMCGQDDFEYPADGASVDITGIFSSYVDTDGITYYYIDTRSVAVIG